MPYENKRINSILVLRDKLSRKIKCKFFILVYLYFFDKIKPLIRKQVCPYELFLNISEQIPIPKIENSDEWHVESVV